MSAGTLLLVTSKAYENEWIAKSLVSLATVSSVILSEENVKTALVHIKL